MGCFTRIRDFTWSVSDCEELSGGYCAYDEVHAHYTHARAHEAICFFVLEILLEPIIYLFITKLIISCKSLQLVVARGGIEPPTHGFSVREYILT